jgi:hypothetical protein
MKEKSDRTLPPDLRFKERQKALRFFLHPILSSLSSHFVSDFELDWVYTVHCFLSYWAGGETTTLLFLSLSRLTVSFSSKKTLSSVSLNIKDNLIYFYSPSNYSGPCWRANTCRSKQWQVCWETFFEPELFLMSIFSHSDVEPVAFRS